MCSDAIVVASVRFQNSAQMCLAQNNDVVQTLAPDRSDQPFGKAILPRRGRCSRLVADAHGAQSACDEGAVDPIPIANEVLRGIIPRKCLGYLMRNPFRRWVCGNAEPEDLSSAVGARFLSSTLR